MLAGGAVRAGSGRARRPSARPAQRSPGANVLGALAIAVADRVRAAAEAGARRGRLGAGGAREPGRIPRRGADRLAARAARADAFGHGARGGPARGRRARRAAPGADRRAVSVALTPAGARPRRERARRASEALEDALAGLDAARARRSSPACTRRCSRRSPTVGRAPGHICRLCDSARLRPLRGPLPGHAGGRRGGAGRARRPGAGRGRVAFPLMPNVFEPDWDAERDEPPFRWRRARIGRQAGARDLGASLFELPPGAASFPLHAHYANEEMIVVLDGRPTLTTAPTARARELEPGEVVACPAGRDGAHRLDNHVGRARPRADRQHDARARDQRDARGRHLLGARLRAGTDAGGPGAGRARPEARRVGGFANPTPHNRSYVNNPVATGTPAR